MLEERSWVFGFCDEQHGADLLIQVQVILDFQSRIRYTENI